MKAFRGGMFVFLAIIFSLKPALGQTFWVGNGAGVYEDSSQWENGVPTSTVVGQFLTGASFTIPGVSTFEGSDITTYTVTFATADPAAEALRFRAQDSAPSGDSGAGPGIVNLELGSSTLTIAGQGSASLNSSDFYIDNGATVNLSGGTVQVNQGVVGVGDIEADLTIGYDGSSTRTPDTGTGALTISSGTLNFTAGSAYMFVGAGSTAVGTVTQSGTATVSGGDVYIGLDKGNGTYDLTAGNLSVSSISLAYDTSSVGTFTQSGGSLSTTGVFSIGTDGTGSYTLSAGTANVGFLYVGENASSSGTVSQTGGTLTTDGMSIGSSGTGTYTLTAGSIIDTGTLALGGLDATGTLTQSGGTLTVSDSVSVGDTGTGTYNLSGGSATFSGGLDITSNSGASGTVNQTGGSLTIDTSLNVGDGDAGTYDMSGGTLTLNGTVSVGGTTAAGAFNQTGGTVDASAVSSFTINSAGSYNLDGGTLKLGVSTISGTGGTFNFGGGTLEVTSTALADSLSGTVTGASTINAPTAGTTVTLSGDLSGSGSMTYEGSSTSIFNLTGSNSYSGGTTVSDGTLNATTSSLPEAGPLSIASGAAVNLTGSSEFIHTGALTGAGTLTFGSFNFEQNGTLDFTGTVNVGTNGTLQVFNGTLGTVAGTAANLTVGGDSTVATSGTVTLNSAGTYTGFTTINSGFTLLANTGLDTRTVNNNGSFGNGGAIGNITIGPGASGALNQPQEATTAQEGTLLVRVTGNVADSFTAATADLYGKIGISGYSAIGTTAYRIVNATGGMTTGTLNNSTATGLAAVPASSSSLLTGTLSFSSSTAVTTPTTGQDNLYLIVTQLPLTQFALTPNQVAVATSLDGALASPSANDSLFAAIDSVSSSSLPGVLDQLSPRPYLYMRDLAFENSTFLAQGINARLAGVRGGFSGLDTSGLSLATPGLESSLGRSLGSMLAYNSQGVAPNGVNYYPEDPSLQPTYPSPASTDSLTTAPSETRTISDSPDYGMTPTPAPMPRASGFNAPNFSEFISGDLILADLSQKSANNIPNAHATAADATAGVAFKITPHLAVGALFDYNHSDAKTDSEGSHVRADTYSPGLYGTFFDGGFYVNGLFTYGFNDYSDDRAINLGGGNATATSSAHGQQYSGALDFGYDFHPGRDAHWTLGPDLGLQYTHLHVDSFTESGAGLADLAVGSQDADSLRGRLGGHLLYQVRSASIVFAPDIFAAYQREFLDNTFGLTSQFDIPGTTPFTIQGTHPNRNSALVGIGASATFDNSLSLYLNYIAEIGTDDYLVQSVQGGLKASF